MASTAKPGKRSVRFNTSPPKKDVEVLTDVSLVMLTRHVCQEKDFALVFPMLLNIPTTTIIQHIYSVCEDGVGGVNEKHRVTVAEQLVLHWKKLTSEGKTKDRINEMEKALRHMGRTDIAETFLERHANNQEITQDAFP